MGFDVQLQNRNFSMVEWPAGVRVSVVRYGARAVGGPSEAEILVTGPSEALVEALRWLRYKTTIRNPQGTAVWWGFVEGVEVVAGALWDRVSLQSMWNRVAVTYAYNGADGGWERAQTAWAQDDESVGRFGTREYIFALGDGEDASATAQRDEILRMKSKPTSMPMIDASEPGVRLYCKGLWETLNWKYFQRLEGRIENEGTGGRDGVARGLEAEWIHAGEFSR